MPTEIQFRNFSAEDRRTYGIWRRHTVLAYVAVILFGLAIVSVLVSMQAGTVAEYDAGAIGMVAP